MSLLLTSLSGCSIFRCIPFLYTPLGFIFLITKYKLWCWIDLALGLHIYGFSSPQHQEFLCMSETCVSNIHQEKCFQEISYSKKKRSLFWKKLHSNAHLIFIQHMYLHTLKDSKIHIITDCKLGTKS